MFIFYDALAASGLTKSILDFAFSAQARRVEEFYIRRWSGRGTLAPDHPLLLSNPDVRRFLVDSSV